MNAPRNSLFAYYASVQSSLLTIAKGFRDDGPVVTKLDELIDAVSGSKGGDDIDITIINNWFVVYLFLTSALDQNGKVISVPKTARQPMYAAPNLYKGCGLTDVGDIARYDADLLADEIGKFMIRTGYAGGQREAFSVARQVKHAAGQIAETLRIDAKQSGDQKKSAD